MTTTHRAFFALCALATVGAVFYAIAQTPEEDVVRATRFELVDASGNVKAVLGQVESGNPGLVLYGANGERRAALRVMGDDTARLHLFHRDGSPRAWMALDWTGKPALTLFGEDMRPRASLATMSDWSTRLDLMGKDGQIKWTAP